MTAPTLTEAAAAPAALTAFLRGVERRGALLAELLCGDARSGDAALAVAMRAFRNNAVQLAVADWPGRFWSLLLAVPQLRDPARSPRWQPEFAVLERLGNGARAALLLRLVAGLGDAEAAAVLGIARPTYRLALQHALPHRSDGSPDAASWRGLADATRQALRELPAERLSHLAALREAALQGSRRARSGPRPSAPQPQGGRHQRRWPRLAWVAGAACAVAFAATFFLPVTSWLPRGDAPQVRVEPLPPAEPPAATFDAATALLTHRDFDQLLDPRDQALVEHLDFYAWYAAQLVPGAGDARSGGPAATVPGSDAEATREPGAEDNDAPR